MPACRKGVTVLNTIRVLGGRTRANKALGAQPSTPDARRSASNRILSTLVFATFVGGVLIMASGIWTSGHVDWLAIIFLTVLTALSERFDWSLYGSSRVSIAFAPIMAAVALFGLAGLAVVVPVAILTSYLGSSRPVGRAAYNFGVLMLAGAAASRVFVVSGLAGWGGGIPIRLRERGVVDILNF